MQRFYKRHASRYALEADVLKVPLRDHPCCPQPEGSINIERKGLGIRERKKTGSPAWQPPEKHPTPFTIRKVRGCWCTTASATWPESRQPTMCADEI